MNWKIISEAELEQKCEIITKVSDFGRIYIYFEIGIAAPFSKHLAMSMSLLNRYDSYSSTEAIKRNDLTLIAGITMKF